MIFNYRSVTSLEAEWSGALFLCSVRFITHHPLPPYFLVYHDEHEHPPTHHTMNEFTFNQPHSINPRPCVLWSYKHWLWFLLWGLTNSLSLQSPLRDMPNTKGSKIFQLLIFAKFKNIHFFRCTARYFNKCFSLRIFKELYGKFDFSLNFIRYVQNDV